MAAPQIHGELAGFLASGVSVLLGSRDGRLIPECARATGVDVLPGGEEIVVFLPVAIGAATIANLRAHPRLAVTFSRIDHRSFQVKGTVVEIRAASEAERPRVERYLADLARSWGSLGQPPQITLRLAHWPCHAIRLRIEKLFDQTPGPGAGNRLAPGDAAVPS